MYGALAILVPALPERRGAAPQALSFDQHTPPPDAGPEWRSDADKFQRALVHVASLLHGVALQHLRGDWDLDNLVEHDHHAPPPANVSPRRCRCSPLPHSPPSP